jgi:hypothetical protein
MEITQILLKYAGWEFWEFFSDIISDSSDKNHTVGAFWVLFS